MTWNGLASSSLRIPIDAVEPPSRLRGQPCASKCESIRAVSRDLNQLSARGQILACVLTTIFKKQFNSGFETLDAFLLRFTLAIRLGKFWAKRYKPFTLAMNLGIDRDGHRMILTSVSWFAKCAVALRCFKTVGLAYTRARLST
jgi:hypothetical protein